jgi:signal peptidase I
MADEAPSPELKYAAWLFAIFLVSMSALGLLLRRSEFMDWRDRTYGFTHENVQVKPVTGLIKRGDVVVFRTEKGPRSLRRVVGVAGDRVEMKKGRLLVNGSEIRKNALPARECSRPPHIECVYEELGAAKYMTWVEREDSPEIALVQVPPNTLYVLGDDRVRKSADKDMDSRDLGPIPVKSVLGIALH